MKTPFQTHLVHTHLCSWSRRSGWHVCEGNATELFRKRQILFYMFGWGILALQVFCNSLIENLGNVATYYLTSDALAVSAQPAAVAPGTVNVYTGH